MDNRRTSWSSKHRHAKPTLASWGAWMPKDCGDLPCQGLQELTSLPLPTKSLAGFSAPVHLPQVPPCYQADVLVLGTASFVSEQVCIPCADRLTLLLVSFPSAWSGWKCRTDCWHGCPPVALQPCISAGSSTAYKGLSCSRSCGL